MFCSRERSKGQSYITSTLLFSNNGMGWRDCSGPESIGRRQGCGFIRAEETPNYSEQRMLILIWLMACSNVRHAIVCRRFWPVLFFLFTIQGRQVGAHSIVVVEHTAIILSLQICVTFYLIRTLQRALSLHSPAQLRTRRDIGQASPRSID